MLPDYQSKFGSLSHSTQWQITSPLKVYDPIDWVSTSNFQGVMTWSKRPKSLTEKGEFGPHALPISSWFLKEMVGASWHWQVGINP